MDLSSRSVRWFQILLTLFYGQVLSTSIYEYIIQGICGLIFRLRPIYDSILLIILGLLMFAFVLYALPALWYNRIRTSMISLVILILITILTAVKSVIEIYSMGQHPTRIEWMIIRIVEFIWRIFGLLISTVFLIRLRQGFKPEKF